MTFCRTRDSSRQRRAPVFARKADESIDRYFTVDDFRELKKVGKRDDNLPSLELLSDIELNKPTEEEINTNARIISNTLLEFDVETEVIDVKVGPTVTQYAVSPYTEQHHRRRRARAQPRARQRDHQPERRSCAGAVG